MILSGGLWKRLKLALTTKSTLWRCKSSATPPVYRNMQQSESFLPWILKLTVPPCFPAVSTFYKFIEQKGELQDLTPNHKFISKTENRCCSVGEVMLKRSGGGRWTVEEIWHKVTGLAVVWFWQRICSINNNTRGKWVLFLMLVKCFIFPEGC